MPQWWETASGSPQAPAPAAPPSSPAASAWWDDEGDPGSSPSDPSIALPEPDSTDSLPLWKRILSSGLRSGGGLVGGLLGAAGGEILEPLGGGIPGAIAGKGAGGALGEYLAEKLEGRDANPLEVAGNAAISMVPFGKEASAGWAATKGALIGGADTGYRELAEGGSLDAGDIGKSAALGAATAGLLHRVTGGRLGKASEPEPVTAPTPPPVEPPVSGKTYDWTDLPSAGPMTRASQVEGLNLIDVIRRTPNDRVMPVPSQFGRARTILPPLETPPPASGGTPLEGFGFGMPRAEDQASLDFLDPELSPTRVNGSGESSASIEALNRANSMRGSGDRFVRFDQFGNKVDLSAGNGPDAVDIFPRPGELTAIEHADGTYTIRDNNGGRLPLSAVPAGENPSITQFMRPFRRPLASLEGGNGLGPDEPYNLSEFEPPPGTRTTTALTPKRPMLPADFVSVWRNLQERGADQVARQAGDEIPFTVDPREGLATFAKRINESDPRDLMNLERQAKAMLPVDDSGEAGFVNPAAIVEGTKKIASEVPDLAERYRYFSLFSNPAIALKKVLGDTSNAVGEALEQGLAGDPQKAARILKSFFSPQTLQDVGSEFKSAAASDAGTEGFGAGQGILGLPSRVLAAITNAAKNAHARAGLSPEEAKDLTFTGTPKSDILKSLVEFQQGGKTQASRILRRIAMPVARVATNIFERGLERTPGVGMVMPGAMDNLKLALIRQGLGAGAGLAGYETYDPNDKSPATHSLAGAAFGRYALPYAIGQALAAAERHPTSKVPAYDRVSDAIFGALPYGEATDFRPSHIAKQLVPWFLRDNPASKH